MSSTKSPTCVPKHAASRLNRTWISKRWTFPLHRAVVDLVEWNRPPKNGHVEWNRLPMNDLVDVAPQVLPIRRQRMNSLQSNASLNESHSMILRFLRMERIFLWNGPKRDRNPAAKDPLNNPNNRVVAEARVIPMGMGIADDVVVVGVAVAMCRKEIMAGNGRRVDSIRVALAVVVVGTVVHHNRMVGVRNTTGIHRDQMVELIQSLDNLKAPKWSLQSRGFLNCIPRDTDSCAMRRLDTFPKRPIRSSLERCLKSSAFAKGS
jgi:hypothetical protein